MSGVALMVAVLIFRGLLADAHQGDDGSIPTIKDAAVPASRLLNRGHRLAGQPSEGADLLSERHRLGGKAPVLQRVPVALRSPTGGPVHAADARPPNGWRLAL